MGSVKDLGAYAPTSLVLGLAGASIALLTDLGGLGYGVRQIIKDGDYSQAYESGYSIGFGIIGGTIGALAGPETVPVGYALGSFLGGFVGK